MPPDVLEHLCNNKLIITGTKAIPDDIAMGVDDDSKNMSDHVQYDALQTSDLAETVAKRLLEGILLTTCVMSLVLFLRLFNFVLLQAGTGCSVRYCVLAVLV